MTSDTIVESDQMIGFFDVLAFSERVRRSTLAEIYVEYEQLIKIVIDKNGTFIIGRVAVGDGSYAPATGWLATEHAYFSDTVLLWSKFDDFRYPAFCSLCARLICEALEVGMPLRGAIAVGQASLDRTKNIFVGLAVVEAHDVENAQAWLGVSFAPSAAKLLQSFDPRLVLAYAHHRKDGNEQLVEGAVLDWPRVWRENYKNDLVSVLMKLQDRIGSHPYIGAAIEFARFSEKNHDWFLSTTGMGISDSHSV